GAHALLMDHDVVGHSAGAHLFDRGRRRIGVVRRFRRAGPRRLPANPRTGHGEVSSEMLTKALRCG
ncbi:hypothetical protein ABZ892_00005, partial [Streptomyces sp. NPDC046924]|uniref:hypothetical protein n=1 Tax=Streptomyces sp. NPDC046924 TaxID=3155136 RepID=UPI0033F93BFD